MSWTHATTNLYQPCGLSAFDQRENQRTSQRRCTLSSQARTNLQSLTDIFNFLSSPLFSTLYLRQESSVYNEKT